MYQYTSGNVDEEDDEFFKDETEEEELSNLKLFLIKYFSRIFYYYKFKCVDCS